MPFSLTTAHISPNYSARLLGRTDLRRVWSFLWLVGRAPASPLPGAAPSCPAASNPQARAEVMKRELHLAPVFVLLFGDKNLLAAAKPRQRQPRTDARRGP